MTVVTIEKARDQLDDLVARAEAGEEIILSRAERPAVRLAVVETVTEAPPIRTPGKWKGKFSVPDDFFDPLSEEELRLWEDGPVFPPEQT